MAIPLTQVIQDQIDNKRLDVNFTFKINGTDRTSYLLSYSIGFDKSFGSASGIFNVSNAGGVFGDDGAWQIKVGDVIELIEQFHGDSTEFKNFYGIVEQRGIVKNAQQRVITLNCLDYISILQKTDIDLDVEGTKVKIEEETLTPSFLPSPNDDLAQVFNFANNGLAQSPTPLLTIRPRSGTTLVGESPQFDGFDIKYDVGQVIMGTPLNAGQNYDLVATSYHFYTQGVYAEDIIEAILTQIDGYGKYLFGETSPADVITNHLTTTFLTEEGVTEDYMTPNLTTSTIAIKTTLTSDYDPDESGGDPTVLNVTDTSGFPSNGTASVSGDIFTYTGKTSTTFTGVSESGSNALKAHPTASVVEYETTYDPGRVWFLKYSNVTSELDESGGSFENLPSGITIDYIDTRFGRIILSDAISLSTSLKHVGDYTFKTLQATGILLNRMKFSPRETDNRFDAINKVRAFLAPNYIIRTEGDNRIWSSYLSQRTTADYTLALTQKLNYLEDEDLYTRVVFFGRNINPSNLTHNDGVAFVDSGQNFKSTATQSELQFVKTENNFHEYRSTISDAGYIDTTVIKPIVYINNVPVDDNAHTIAQMPVIVTVTAKLETITEQKKSGGPTVTTRQYFYYKIRFAHTSIDATKPITVHNAVGETILTISPGQGGMNYAAGVYNVPGSSQNSVIEQASNATYVVFYSTSGIDIDAENVRFRISQQLIPSTTIGIVAATFQYWTAVTPFDSIGSVIDGRFETQVQTEFYAEPPNGLPYAILDLGQIYDIQAMDIIAGFYRPDDIRKFDINFSFSIQYSNDNLEYFYISPETQNLDLSGGDAISLDEDKLGVNFSARYLRIDIEDVKKINYKDGVWPVAFAEISIYNDIVLKSEATLIPYSELSADVTVTTLDSSGVYPTSFQVDDASAFTIPDSGETEIAYINDDAFTYTDIESGIIFVGVEGLSDDHLLGDRVSQTLSDSSSFYDVDGILQQLGDRLYKEIRVRDDILYDQTRLDALAKAFLSEFYKNHTKLKVDVLYAPYLKVGQTIALTDPYQGLDNVRYFIESISNQSGFYSLVLARFPV